MPRHEFFVMNGRSRQCEVINVSEIVTIKALKAAIARLFFVADADGISFYGGLGCLPSLDDIEANNTPVEVRISDSPVRELEGLKSLPAITTGVNFTKKVSDPSHPLYFMRSPECLFTCESDAPAFAMARKFLPPSMSPRAVRHYTPMVHASLRKCYLVFDELDERDLAFNVYQYILKLAGQVIWKVILGMYLEHFILVDAKPHETLRWLADVGVGIDEAIKGEGDLPLNEAALRATCVILAGAGFVTTSSLLSWIIYALCKYPGNQERLLQELVDHDAGPDKESLHDE
ncbi:cytochrome P450 82A2 [Zalerion maritima]|uniref:Cytochrome P450 82A2 n=1 Tax=Zalerion maritima TaxID=339359 RepID=A0AAD5RLQ5_9PEZI|nr:cytochrome P450 82A2 [Zalerion maritima]